MFWKRAASVGRARIVLPLDIQTMLQQAGIQRKLVFPIKYGFFAIFVMKYVLMLQCAVEHECYCFFPVGHLEFIQKY
jgi:hypothetical protein